MSALPSSPTAIRLAHGPRALPAPFVADPDRHQATTAALLERLGLGSGTWRERHVAVHGGADFLALGCALLGARVTWVAAEDADPRVAEWMEQVFLRHRRPLRIVADPTAAAAADLVLAGDALAAPATDEAARVARLRAGLPPSVPLLVAWPDRACHRRRALQRRVLSQLAAREADVERCARRLFPASLAAEEERTGRSAAATLTSRFLSQLAAPHVRPALAELIEALGAVGEGAIGAVDPAPPAGLAASRHWEGGGGRDSASVAAALDELELEIARRDYDERDLERLDGGPELDVVRLVLRGGC